MYTLTVDDRELVVTLMLGILRNLDPDGTHLGATDPQKALRLAKESPLDVAFLDVEMPGEINGLDLGKRLRQCYPKLNIVIITGHSEYAVDAFGLDASGYLLKPLTQEAVAHQLSVLRFAPEKEQGANIRIRCFGTFEVFCNGTPMDFSYSKSKELLAVLVDRHGAICSNDPADQSQAAEICKRPERCFYRGGSFRYHPPSGTDRGRPGYRQDRLRLFPLSSGGSDRGSSV